MNPIPLSAPDGRVYAYACGRCHHVGGGSSMLVREDLDGPLVRLVDHSRRDADQCCTCHDCRTPLTRDEWRGYCTMCSWRIAFARAWRDIWTALPCHPIVTKERWGHIRRAEEDDDE